MLSVFIQIIDDYETGTVAGGHISRELMKVVSLAVGETVILLTLSLHRY